MDIENIVIELSNNGLLKPNKISGNWYSCTCPFHNGGSEKRPSFGILLHSEYRNGTHYPEGFSHCFRGDTRVLTNFGSVEIATLCDRNDVQIINGNGEWEHTIFKNYGVQQLWKIELTQDQRNKTIYTTENHEWFVHNRGDKCNIYKTYELPVGKYLQSLILKPESFKIDLDGIIHGIIYGDGVRSHTYKYCSKIKSMDHNNPTGVSYHIRIPKFTKKIKLAEYFEQSEYWNNPSQILISDKEYLHYGSKRFPLNHNYKEVPSIDNSRDYLMSFLAGYFACDGSIDLVNISSAKFDDLLKIKDICIKCGISVVSFRQQIHDTQYKLGANLYHLRLYPSSIPPEFYVLDEPVTSKYSRSRWKIASVEPTDIFEPVYCCETSTKSFVLDNNILTHNCFTCGYAGTLQDLVTKILKTKNISQDGLEWLKENIPEFDLEGENPDFDYLLSQDTMQSLINDFAINQIQQMSNPVQYVSEEELAKYRFTVPYMYERKLTDAIIEEYDIGFQADWIPPGRKKPVPCITIPVRDKEGRTLFFCRRSIEGKLYNYPEGVVKPVFGIDRVKQGEPVIVCESAINALTARVYGYQAVALLGTGNAYQAQQLKELGVNDFILCFDGDEAGRKATEKWRKILRKVAFVWAIKMPDGKDLNDCSKEEFDKLYEGRE